MNNRKPSMFYGADTVIFENTKALRNNMTPAEKALWEKLSKNQLGVRFKAQHPIGNFIVDFYCHKAKLIIEIDGVSHFNEETHKQDNDRTHELEQAGLKIIRFTNEQIFKSLNEALEQIKSNLY